MAGLDDLRDTFFQECEDLLERLAEGLRDLAANPAAPDLETVHAVFRAVHSIKGGGAAFGLEDLVGFAHLYETVLDGLRSGRMTPDDAAMQTLLRAGDVLADLAAAARDGTPPPKARADRIALELDLLAEGAGGDPSAGDFDFQPVLLSFDPLPLADGEAGGAILPDPEAGPDTPPDTLPGPVPAPPPGGPGHVIRFAPHGALYATGNEPAALFRALGRLGGLEVQADLSLIPPLCAFDPAAPGLRWSLRLMAPADPAAIARVFEFVEGLADLEICPLPATDGPPAGTAPPGPAAGAILPFPAPPPASSAPPPLPPADPAPVSSAPVSSAPVPSAPVPSAPVPPPRPAAAPPTAASPTAAPAETAATIRVNLARVDRLINLIGELVIMEAMLSQVIAKAGLGSTSEAAAGLDRIRQLAGEIQESVMAIRAQPLRPVFQRMDRILRDVTEATGKRARLVTQGEATEVDKTVIERLVDPLTHMIRNSVDHGLESAPARAAAGKPAEGTITLSAAHRSGRVLIEVSDDGGGIDRARVRAIAEEKGLIAPGTPLSPAETDALLFLPGFSSKTEVSAISGRGVGLDVVRREIQALGGRVSISSVEGLGTTFTIALPLTLAVVEGMLVSFGGQTMVLPLSAIVETLSPASATIHALGRRGRVVLNRGELIPILDLAQVFGLPGPPPAQGVLVIATTDAGSRAALAVDRILDQRQVVIKSLEDNYRAVPGISAATILGDGHVALIIDPEELVGRALADHPAVSAPLRRKG